MTDELSRSRAERRQLRALEKRLETAQKQSEQVRPLEAELMRQKALLQEWDTWAEDAEEKNAHLVEKNLKLQEALAAMEKLNRKVMVDHWQTLKAQEELEQLYTISDMVALSKPDEIWAKKEGQVKKKAPHKWDYWRVMLETRPRRVVMAEYREYCKQTGITPKSESTFDRNTRAKKGAEK